MDYKSNRQMVYAALRSGKYKQCFGQIYDGGSYCALGVAAITLKFDLYHTPTIDVHDAMNFKRNVLLWKINDRRLSFPEIADELEYNEDKYFKLDEEARQ